MSREYCVRRSHTWDKTLPCYLSHVFLQNIIGLELYKPMNHMIDHHMYEIILFKILLMMLMFCGRGCCCHAEFKNIQLNLMGYLMLLFNEKLQIPSPSLLAVRKFQLMKKRFKSRMPNGMKGSKIYWVHASGYWRLILCEK